ncbi:9e048455-d80f-4b5b-8f4c-b2c50c5f419a [Sclerotinia trifoliorum]|uniref:9e048455-d80f-4b5b-8f4c-b2c50c5f419a n=1 Tax=Sclerotinia trifoliorum TaxID=28548 RepID=A0A8H2VZP0_9HELO|nr:9e048455-d80f-4b5b-8f4c-b2c50c5f419a [Sclerotinia trifoliorum]
MINISDFTVPEFRVNNNGLQMEKKTAAQPSKASFVSIYLDYKRVSTTLHFYLYFAMDPELEGSPGFHLPAFNPEASISQQDCLDAMRGELIPAKLESFRMIACIVHGLRYNEAFAESEPMNEVCAKSTNKVLARARNACLIMSNKIPLMTNDEEKPYCIWHPQVATIDTYRGLVRKYPDMRYHVARACAIGGYVDLYRELDLLRDISIAEEARDNIGVTSSPQTYSRPPAPEHVSLLYNPLPLHLPTTNKDALIVHAAYESNIDRYARLRRPVMISSVEGKAVVRGIYHHTAFAHWLVSQPFSFFQHMRHEVKEAITARFIMANDLSRISDDSVIESATTTPKQRIHETKLFS